MRELDLVLIEYDHPDRNVFEVTEEFYCHNGAHGKAELKERAWTWAAKR